MNRIGRLALGLSFWIPLAASCASVATFDYPMASAKAAQALGKEVIRFIPAPASVSRWITRARLEGSYGDLGRQIGRIAKGTVVRPKQVSDARRALNQGMIDMYRGFYPAYLEECAAIGAEFGMKLEDMDLSFMEERFFVTLGWLGLDYELRKGRAFGDIPTTACSILAAKRGPDAPTLVGRNFEWLQPNGTIVENAMAGDYRSVGMSIISPDHWVMDGVNEKGFFIGVMSIDDSVTPVKANGWANKVWPKIPIFPAVDSHHLERILLNSCATVAEAIEKTSRVRVYYASEACHYLVADAGGDMAVFEFDQDGRLVVVRSRRPDALLSTNFWLDGDDPFARATCWRYNLGQNDIAESGLPADEEAMLDRMLRISNDPTNPFLARIAPAEAFRKNQTVWTSVYDLGRLSMRVRFSFGSEFQSLSLGCGPEAP